MINFIKSLEDSEATSLYDVAGYRTIGYGPGCETDGCTEATLVLLDGSSRRRSVACRRCQGEHNLGVVSVRGRRSSQQFELCFGSADSSVRLNANQYGVLVSWSWNVGCGIMRSCTVVGRLNARENPNKLVATRELPKWNLAGERKFPGRGRQKEVQLFQARNESLTCQAIMLLRCTNHPKTDHCLVVDWAQAGAILRRQILLQSSTAQFLEADSHSMPMARFCIRSKS
ncbi:glycoside hydrolase family 24 protein [Dothistroma septosporum NZE10]|uniref:Glycoside hydrolase family 24 protein n=1 Tax=Dothistroma septosporum (strain NZE10 / CBS 128990) TaxID=675120 RepID=N1Q2Z3_DOTSN|nr:glycoside hydrolase family 24 protein [Dothistroma septosporum NZE10]